MNLSLVIWKSSVFLWLVFEMWFIGTQASKLSKFKVLWETRISYHFLKMFNKEYGCFDVIHSDFWKTNCGSWIRNLFFPKLCKISKREPCLRDQMAGDAALPGAGDAECAWGWDVQATPPGQAGLLCLGRGPPRKLVPSLWSCPYPQRPTCDWECHVDFWPGLFPANLPFSQRDRWISLIWYSLTFRNCNLWNSYYW